jgi:pseudaminic acid biosynthesis-associated methylase
MTHSTDQENFWAGEFGEQYIARNNSAELLTSKMIMWSKMLRSAHNITSIHELGCNIGLNLVAIKQLIPNAVLSGVEINETAAIQARQNGIATITTGTLLDQPLTTPADLTAAVTVLIHINPAELHRAYKNLVESSNRYVLIAEYYNPVPTKINYRGHEDRLFKRDFAGELMDEFQLNLIDYGFFYHRDKYSPQDDISWFLMEK